MNFKALDTHPPPSTPNEPPNKYVSLTNWFHHNVVQFHWEICIEYAISLKLCHQITFCVEIWLEVGLFECEWAIENGFRSFIRFTAVTCLFGDHRFFHFFYSNDCVRLEDFHCISTFRKFCLFWYCYLYDFFFVIWDFLLDFDTAIPILLIEFHDTIYLIWC